MAPPAGAGPQAPAWVEGENNRPLRQGWRIDP
jgi:hypothetical protein